MRFSLPSIKCSEGPPSLRLLPNPVRCLNCAQRFDYSALGSSRKLAEEPASIWLTAAKNVFVGWALNFRVRMLLKGAVSTCIPKVQLLTLLHTIFDRKGTTFYTFYWKKVSLLDFHKWPVLWINSKKEVFLSFSCSTTIYLKPEKGPI